MASRRDQEEHIRLRGRRPRVCVTVTFTGGWSPCLSGGLARWVMRDWRGRAIADVVRYRTDRQGD